MDWSEERRTRRTGSWLFSSECVCFEIPNSTSAAVEGWLALLPRAYIMTKARLICCHLAKEEEEEESEIRISPDPSNQHTFQLAKRADCAFSHALCEKSTNNKHIFFFHLNCFHMQSKWNRDTTTSLLWREPKKKETKQRLLHPKVVCFSNQTACKRLFIKTKLDRFAMDVKPTSRQRETNRRILGMKKLISR